jgi:RimJ/RimL family protein N-acetyltransferase
MLAWRDAGRIRCRASAVKAAGDWCHLRRNVVLDWGCYRAAAVNMERVQTQNLELRRPDPVGDLDVLFAIFSDPDGWWYQPAGRHTDQDQTRYWLTRAAERFDTDGLSYWTVRLRDDGTIIGAGGAQRQRTGAWNLSYRLDTAQQGRGYATEVAKKACELATGVDDDVPVIAWIAEHNTPSRRVAERLELVNRGIAIDPSDGVSRLAYADRPVTGFTGGT